MQVGPGDVLRGQQQQEEEGQVGRCVTDELDEGLLDEVSQSALRSQQVDLRRKEEEEDIVWELKQETETEGQREEEKGKEKRAVGEKTDPTHQNCDIM